VLGFAKGLEADIVAEAAVEALRVAAVAGAVLTTASAAVASRRLRIISFLERVKSALSASPTD
jgi:hypothetical protein